MLIGLALVVLWVFFGILGSRFMWEVDGKEGDQGVFTMFAFIGGFIWFFLSFGIWSGSLISRNFPFVARLVYPKKKSR